MNKIPSSSFNPAKIIGPYPLLAAFLLVIETLLGFWLFRADNSIERVIAGILMVSILSAFLYAVTRVSAREKEGSRAISPQGLGEVELPKEEASPQQIESPAPEVIVAPDRSYTIMKPPEDWIVRELTGYEFLRENLGISDPILGQKLLGNSPQSSELLLVFQTKSIISLLPIPGKTSIDGVKFPTALEISLITQLSITPMNRAQPPFFFERPFEHNFFQQVSSLFNMNVLTLYKQSAGINPISKRKQLICEFRQDIQNITMNGKEIQELASNVVMIGIEGDIRDYLLVMKYPSSPALMNTELAQQLQVFQSLITSFRPAKLLNPERKLKEFRESAQRQAKDFITSNGQDFFIREFQMMLYRISGLDLDNSDNRLKVMKWLKPFELMAKNVGIQDQQIASLWDSLQEAEKGNASDFKNILTKLIEIAIPKEKTEEALQSKDDEETAGKNAPDPTETL